MIYIGIDPGKTGGISIIKPDEMIYKMPDTEKLVMQTFLPWNQLDKITDIKCIIEAQHAFPGMGAKAQWTFAQHYGFIRGVLVTLGIPFIEVSPQKWMAYFGFKRLPNEDKKKHKIRILQKAQNLFPNSSVTLQTADSLMIAEYLRLTDRS